MITTEDAPVIERLIVAGVKAATAVLTARLAETEARVAELESRPTLFDKGVWKAGDIYGEGAVVTHAGSAWVCFAAHVSTEAFDHTCFRLMVKHGKDRR